MNKLHPIMLRDRERERDEVIICTMDYPHTHTTSPQTQYIQWIILIHILYSIY